MIVLIAAAMAADGSLEAAYQKEFAYLRAERSELEARLAEVDHETDARVGAAKAELDTLQGRLVGVTRQADLAEDGFAALDRETSAMDDAGALLSTTTNQAAETLGLPTTAGLPEIFTAATAKLAAQNQTGWQPGRFFLPDGTEVEGRIYRWGQIAAWGESPAGSGALAPAGEGRLQVRRAFGQESAAALAGTTAPARLAVHLYEPERAVEEAEKAGGLLATLEEAGTMGQVVFSLGVVSAILVVIRALTLLFARRGGMPLVEAVAAHVNLGRLDNARALLARHGGPISRTLSAILEAAERSPEELDRVVDESILRETPGIDRFASALTVITAGAPLLGLLGTVTGMIATFDVITEHGTGNPKLMSAGIAEALLCTALGLSVAIPTLLAGNVLASIGAQIKTTLDRGALTLLNTLEVRRRVRPGPALETSESA